MTRNYDFLPDDGDVLVNEIARLNERVRELEAAEQKELAWTIEKPTTPGWYWLRSRHMSPVEVDRERDGKLYVWVNSLDVPVASIRGEWAGPIPLPQEKSE